jgi:uncharacterized membrane protein YdbT with pleckstrin-like domain
MRYLDKNLLPDERILFRTKKSLIVFLYPTLWTLFSCFASVYMLDNPILARIAWAPWLIALIFWLQTGLDYITSDYAVTNKRVMLREGFIYRHVNETRLNAIIQISVGQSLLGQWLNYGTILISAMGANDSFSQINEPRAFQQAVNERLEAQMG